MIISIFQFLTNIDFFYLLNNVVIALTASALTKHFIIKQIKNRLKKYEKRKRATGTAGNGSSPEKR